MDDETCIVSLDLGSGASSSRGNQGAFIVYGDIGIGGGCHIGHLAQAIGGFDRIYKIQGSDEDMGQCTIIARGRSRTNLPGRTLKISIFAHTSTATPVVAAKGQVITGTPHCLTGPHIAIIYLQMGSSDRGGINRAGRKRYRGNMWKALRESPAIATTDKDRDAFGSEGTQTFVDSCLFA